MYTFASRYVCDKRVPICSSLVNLARRNTFVKDAGCYHLLIKPPDAWHYLVAIKRLKRCWHDLVWKDEKKKMERGERESHAYP